MNTTIPTATSPPWSDHSDLPALRAGLQAASTSAVMIDVSDRLRLELTGPDRQAFLHNFCTNQIRALQPGEGREAFVCNVKGRILGHIFVFATVDRLLVEAAPGQSHLGAHFERYHLLEEFRLVDRSADTRELLVTGPQAGLLLRAAGLDVPTSPSPLMSHTLLRVLDQPVDVLRTGLCGPDSWLLRMPVELAGPLTEQLSRAGLANASRGAYESLRIAAGFPHAGQDVTDENLAQEAARTSRAIVFDKGCYLGQEPIHRLFAMGHVNRQLTRLRLRLPSDDTSALLCGAVLTLRSETTEPSKEVGRLTSLAPSAEPECWVGLALLRCQHATPGTKLAVAQATAEIEVGEPIEP